MRGLPLEFQNHFKFFLRRKLSACQNYSKTNYANQRTLFEYVKKNTFDSMEIFWKGIDLNCSMWKES